MNTEEPIYWVATKSEGESIDKIVIEKTKDKSWPEVLRAIADTLDTNS